MQLATLASPARATPGRFAVIPSWLEALAVAATIVLLLPAFAQVADFGPGRDRRFTEAGFRIEGLPAPLLPALCREQAAAAEAALRERLCPGIAPVAPRDEGARIPAAIADALARSSQVFAAPLNRANERLAALRQQQREGAELRVIADAMAAIEADLRPFVERFQLGGADAAGPRPLALRGALGRGGARRRRTSRPRRAPTACCCSPPRSTAGTRSRASPAPRPCPRAARRRRPAAAARPRC